jgi:hypothetical protein
MQIDLEPKIEALLQAQVAAGYFKSIEDAITAAVLGVPLPQDTASDLSWAIPCLDEADAEIATGNTFSEAEVFDGLEQRSRSR